MNRTIALPHSHAQIASLSLTLYLVVLAGSSGCGGSDTTSAEPGPLDKSEIAAIKNESKNGREFINAVKRKTLEKAGIASPIDDLKRKSSAKGSLRRP
jgi:hypothetical protein